MPKRTDIKSILILGAGPIVIGQACEFDYSGAQACKALREEGYRVILVNSNPATIMTDPEMADATYIEPIHWEVVRKIIEKERPDAVLPTMGGQTALNCALELERQGVLEEFGVTMIGATADAIDKAEDRRRFDVAMKKIGLETARSGIAHTMEEALAVAADVGFPCIIRPSFTMGGSGGGIAYNREEFEEICARGLDLSPTKELLIDESLIGWKEYEMEVVRDKNDNCIIVCSIENFDAMGIHTGDSITVAPAQTLTDKEYQIMRNASMAVLREIGVETGGSNVQFAVNPKNGRLIVIEMNPRVSRSSALASKATGFPIAKVAAKLAVGYTLDELMNVITGERYKMNPKESQGLMAGEYGRLPAPVADAGNQTAASQQEKQPDRAAEQGRNQLFLHGARRLRGGRGIAGNCHRQKTSGTLAVACCADHATDSVTGQPSASANHFSMSCGLRSAEEPDRLMRTDSSRALPAPSRETATRACTVASRSGMPKVLRKAAYTHCSTSASPAAERLPARSSDPTVPSSGGRTPDCSSRPRRSSVPPAAMSRSRESPRASGTNMASSTQSPATARKAAELFPFRSPGSRNSSTPTPSDSRINGYSPADTDMAPSFQPSALPQAISTQSVRIKKTEHRLTAPAI